MRAALIPLLAIAAFPAVAAAAFRAEVKDHAALYTNAAVRTADARLQELADQFGVDLVVVTVDLSDAERKRLPRMNPRGQHDALRKRTLEEAQKAGIDGLYVCVYANPGDTCVVVWPEERAETFNANDCEEIRRAFAGPPRGILARFFRERRDESYDDYLFAGIGRIQSALDHPDRPAVEVLQVVVIMGVLVGLWLLLVLVRHRLRGKQPAAQHGNRLPALLGTMFGLPAALPVYDKLLEGGPRPGPDTEPLKPFFAGEPAPEDVRAANHGEHGETPEAEPDPENVQVR